MYIIDFDDTLFNTHRFKQERLAAMLRIGIGPEEYWDTYYQARNNANGHFTYSDYRHAEVLAEDGYDQDEVLEALGSATGRLKDFVFADTFSFLEGLRNSLPALEAQSAPAMVLLSLGDEEFQEIKTRGSGVHDYFDRVFMVDRKKQDVLSELFEIIPQNDVWFINDKVRETIDLRAEFPDMKSVLKKSPAIDQREYEQAGFPFFSTLTEIQRYVTA